MDIKQQITEWADCALDRCCRGDEEREIKESLELVLFAFDTLTDEALGIKKELANDT